LKRSQAENPNFPFEEQIYNLIRSRQRPKHTHSFE